MQPPILTLYLISNFSKISITHLTDYVSDNCYLFYKNNIKTPLSMIMVFLGYTNNKLFDIKAAASIFSLRFQVDILCYSIQYYY